MSILQRVSQRYAHSASVHERLPITIFQGTVATTVCSPADVLKVRRPFRRRCSTFDRAPIPEPYHERIRLREQIDDADDPDVHAERRRDVHVQGLGAGMDASAAHDDAHLHHLRAAEARRRLDPRGPLGQKPPRCTSSAAAQPESTHRPSAPYIARLLSRPHIFFYSARLHLPSSHRDLPTSTLHLRLFFPPSAVPRLHSRRHLLQDVSPSSARMLYVVVPFSPMYVRAGAWWRPRSVYIHCTTIAYRVGHRRRYRGA